MRKTEESMLEGGVRERLMTVAEVADRLNVSPQWVYDHATRSDPRLPCVRLGGAVRFAPSAIDQFIEQQSKLPPERKHRRKRA